MPLKKIIEVNEKPFVKDLSEIKTELKIKLVNRTEHEKTWNHLMKSYHYLSYNQTIGPRVKYLIWYRDRPLAAIGYKQGAYHLKARDEIIGWNKEKRKELLRHVLNNYRYLILPWVQVKNLASHIIALSIRELKKDWMNLYGVEPYILETFVDFEHYKGTCYRAANWEYVGKTSGYAKIGRKYQYHGNKKGVFLYPLKKNFKQLMASTDEPLQVLKNKNYLEMVPMQLQKNIWHETILKEANIKDFMGELPNMFNNFMERFLCCFTRSEQAFNCIAYTKGLLSNLERKSAEPIALEFIEGASGPRNLQFHMRNAKWDDLGAEKIYQEHLSGLISHCEGMITIDESGFVKKGNHSVGVARQYCGSIGKVENCQVGVFVGYSGEKGYGLIAKQLFMPEKWFSDDYAKRREKCLVPEELTFKTKPQIALELLAQIEQSGLFQAKWVGVDSLYGNSKEFLDAVSANYLYFADIHNNTRVWREEPIFELPEYKGRGRRPEKKVANIPSESVSDIAKDDSIPWQKMYLGDGSKGPIYGDVKAVQIHRAFPEENGITPIRSCWLFIRRHEDGSIRYSVSNAPVETSLQELCQASLMRWPIEQCFKEAKDVLGMDHYEFRSWTAWHRHMLSVFIASAFLLEIRLQIIDKKKTVPKHSDGSVTRNRCPDR